MSHNEIDLWYEVKGNRIVDAERFKEVAPDDVQFNGDFEFTTEEGKLRAFTENYHDENSARAVLEPKLRDWEKALLLKRIRIIFRFARATVLDKSEEDIRQSVTISVSPAELVVSPGLVSVLPMQKIPLPSRPMKDSELAQTMVRKLQDLEDSNKQSWCAHAYSILTEIENSCEGGRKGAREKYNICKNVLDKLGELSSQNDPDYNRKTKGNVKRFAPEELDWIKQAAEIVGYRVVEVEYGFNLDDLPLITMDCLPKLNLLPISREHATFDI